jgi:hypothetical protein
VPPAAPRLNDGGRGEVVLAVRDEELVQRGIAILRDVDIEDGDAIDLAGCEPDVRVGGLRPPVADSIEVGGGVLAALTSSSLRDQRRLAQRLEREDRDPILRDLLRDLADEALADALEGACEERLTRGVLGL